MRDEELESLAQESEGAFRRRVRQMEDFRYDEQQEKYWDTTTGNLLGAKSVDGAIHPDDWPTRPDGRNGEPRPYPPSRAINNVDTGLTVEGSTWWPGLPRFINNVVVSERGAMRLDGAVCYNSYIEPQRTKPRKGVKPDAWIEHVKKLYPDPLEHEHFFDFCAHMIQRPDQKVNHGIVMAGVQGIGKDTALLPVRRGVGEWNAAEIGPDAITSQYNGFVRSVLLVINEVRPHDEDHKASNFYNMLKPMLAAPPEMLPMTVKYANTIYVRNLCHVVLTTNDPLTMYIPEEDRRLFVMTSKLVDPKVFEDGYFDKIHAYLADGGADSVVKWLENRPIFEFNYSGPPPMTHGKRAIMDSAHLVRRTLIDDLFESFIEEKMGGKRPLVFFKLDLQNYIKEADIFDDDRKLSALVNAKNFHFKMSERGYDFLACPYATKWKRGKYASRMAFICKSVPRQKQEELIEAALDERDPG